MSDNQNTETPMSSIELKDILTVLPHRYPFVLVDRVNSLELGKSIRAVHNVSANAPWATGHFPENPIFPGVLILEALAQAAGILSFKTREAAGDNKPGKKYLYLFAGVEHARFKRMVTPGDQLILTVKPKRYRKDFAIFEAEATVDGELACSAELLTAIRESDHAE